MWMYWLMFFFSACLALKPVRHVVGFDLRPKQWQLAWRIAFILLVLVFGFRDEVGGDWFSYLNYTDIDTEGLGEVLTQTDPAYALLNWLGSQGLGGIYFVNTVCAMLFTWGLIQFCNVQSRPWLALAVAVPYLVIVVAMGYTRQGVAIGLVMLGLVRLQQQQVFWFLFWVCLAATFHKTAVMLLPLALFSKGNHRWLTILIASVSTYLMYQALVEASLDSLMVSYVEAKYQSSGAAVRIAMNALPAILFLRYKKRFVSMTPEQRQLWMWLSWAALGMVVVLWLSPSSTAVDRMALYCIPLQLVVWSHVPEVFGRSVKRRRLWAFAIVLYAASTLFIWLFFASNVAGWLPYKSYLWESLWQ